MKKILLGCLLVASAVVNAGVSKMAVIDMEKIYSNYYKTQAQSARFDKQKQVYKAYSMSLKKQAEKLKKDYELLLQASQNISLKESVRKAKTLESDRVRMAIRSKEDELVKYNRSKYEELQKKSEVMREGIIKEIRDIVRKTSIIAGYHLVLDISSKGLSGVESVVYYSSYIDLTKSIQDKLNLGK